MQPDWQNVRRRWLLSPSRWKTIALWTSQFLMICAVFAIVRDAADFFRQRAEDRRTELLAVDVLPDGVEQGWRTFVDLQLQQRLRRSGDLLQVVTGRYGYGGRTVYVSPTTPFVVSCDPISAEIVFIDGSDDGSEVPIYGLGASADEPSLPVNWQSVAAKRLSDSLCAATARHVEGMGRGFQLLASAPSLGPKPGCVLRGREATGAGSERQSAGKPVDNLKWA